MTMQELWLKLLANLDKEPREFPTTPKSSRKPLWFAAYADNNDIFVRNAKDHMPSCSIKGERKLTYAIFQKIYPIYLRREKGEHISKEATAITFDQVYWYSLIKHFC